MLGKNSVMQQFCPSWTDNNTVVLFLNAKKCENEPGEENKYVVIMLDSFSFSAQ